MSAYLILAREPEGYWMELGEFEGGWPERALENYLNSRNHDDGVREFLVLRDYQMSRLTATPRTEYAITRPEPALSEVA